MPVTGDDNSPQKKSTKAGPLLMLGSAFSFSLFDILIKLLGPGFTVWDIAFYRFGAGLLLSALIIGFSRSSLSLHNKPLLIIRGIVGVSAFLCLATALRTIPLSTTIVLFYSFPAFAAAFSFLLFREGISRFETICVLMAIAGVAVIFDIKIEGSILGQIFALLAGVIAGLTISIIKKLRETNGSVVIFMFFCIMGTGVSLPHMFTSPGTPSSPLDAAILAGIAVASIFGQLLMNQGFHYCKSWEGGLFLMSEVLFTALFGVFFMGERLTIRFIAGGVLILASVIALNRHGVRRISYRALPPANGE
jgi:drug/metabolite transporter (DMT)-like permease